MSNPAVITLSKASGKRLPIKRFVIEDNIGEAIHLHVDNMRVDFTIKEFLEFSKMIRGSLEEMNLLAEYKLESFDEYFLKECAPFLSDLNTIRVKKVRLLDLKCIVNIPLHRDLILQRLLPITKTPAYLYLKGNKSKFKEYSQFNYHSCSNEERLNSILKSIKDNGYPYQDAHLILFGEENIIRDGQHRAAVLAHLYGVDYDVDVQVFDFMSSFHVFRVHGNNLKALSFWLVREVYRRVKRIVK